MRLILSAGASAALSFASMAHAASDLAADSAAPAAVDSVGAAPASTIIVTGVRGGKPRTVAQSPAPIDVVQADQLSAPGRADLGEALASVLPSIGFGTNTAGVNSIVRPVFNRGLGPAYTLVLVDGKRRHNGALLANGGGDTSGVNPVDFDQLPLSSIAYVEVLKDSAAAQYGSDAVAGVVNVVLKSQDHGFHFSALGGALGEGHGDTATYKLQADAGFKLGDNGGFLHLSADARQRGLTWNNFFATVLPYAPASNPKNAAWNGDGAHNGDPGIKQYSFGYNAEAPLNDQVKLYSFGTAGQRWTVIGNNFRRPNSVADIDQLFPDGFYPLNNTVEYDFQVLFGAKGDWGGTHWDLSTTYGKDHVRQYSEQTINPSLGPSSPTSFSNLATYAFEQWVTNLDLTRGFNIGLPEPLQVSGGFEYRAERFSTYAGDPLAYENGGYVIEAGDQPGDPNVGKLASIGAQAGVVLTPANQVRLTRGDAAGYVDIGVTPIKNWYLGVAARVEHYDDAAGTTFGYKFNSRYEITPWLAVRGTVGTGFRAPSLTQTGYAQTDNRTGIDPNTGAIVPTFTILAPNASPLARALGATDLKPEESTNFGLGVVFTPTSRLSVTIDGYQVDIKNRIIRTGTLFGPALSSILTANSVPASAWVTYFANGVDTSTNGLDVVADYRLGLGDLGRLSLDAALNYNHTRVTRIAPTPAALTALGANPGGSLIFLPRATIGDLTRNLPQTKIILGAQWDVGRFKVDLQETRYRLYHWIRSQLASQDTRYASQWLTDLDVTYEVRRGLSLTLGASNLFDVHPSKNGPGDPTTGSAQFVYGPSPFSPDGGFYYGKVSVDF